MPANFIPVTASEVSQALDWMARLYAHEAIVFDDARARRAVEELIRHPEWGGAWLIQSDGAVMGYVVLTVGYSLEFGGRFGLLDELLVAEECRGKGTGSEALAFAEEWCRNRGLAALRLEVDVRNTRGQNLYRRAGFELQERHPMTRWL